jgi:hypothetical protein
MLKICVKCRVEKPIEDFRKGWKNNLRSECKECGRGSARKHYKNNRERIIAYNMAYYRTHPGKYSTLKRAAKRYKHSCTLTLEDYLELVRKNECHYCGGTLPEVGYGLDRQDNFKGYTKENSVACCEVCNEKKGKLESLGFIYPRTVDLLKEILYEQNGNCKSSQSTLKR